MISKYFLLKFILNLQYLRILIKLKSNFHFFLISNFLLKFNYILIEIHFSLASGATKLIKKLFIYFLSAMNRQNICYFQNKKQKIQISCECNTGDKSYLFSTYSLM